MIGMAPADPGESRRLAEPPSARYEQPTEPTHDREPRRWALAGPLVRAILAAVAGAILLTFVGAILASTAGLLFVAGAVGATVGLVLARAALPAANAMPVPRSRVAWLSVGLSVLAVALAAVATWAYARSEGGTLGLIDYLFETFGPFVPAEAVIASVTAWWGASVGPVQR
jgi:hypothetical protein